jgi:predicted O-methyltransferase YrrM
MLKKFTGLYSGIQLAGKYISYWIRSSNGKGHGMHSPFVYDFITNVLNDRREFYSYRDIENLRATLLKDRTTLQVEDFGAGSLHHHSGLRSVAHIARHSAKPPKYSQLLFRIVNHYHPALIIELGTSLGISAAYLATGNKAARVTTIEGSGEVAAQAERQFESLGLTNITVRHGQFDRILPALLSGQASPDLVFIDGNHRKEPTLNYFDQVASSMGSSGIIILDDIHWSRGMEEAWCCIRESERTMVTIDLFFIGLVFFNPDFKIRQHFSIRF